MNLFSVSSRVFFILFFASVHSSLYAWEQVGVASWYGGEFQGRRTANGEIYDTNRYTAAHKTLPFGTIVEVRNLANGHVVHVRVNDRGPFVDDRIIDLTYAAARDLDIVKKGTAQVRISTDPDSIPPVYFTVQIGAWSNLENAQYHYSRLNNAGLSPRARLESDGITRIVIEKIPDGTMFSLSQKLKAMGYTNLFIYQVQSKHRAQAIPTEG